MSNGSGGTFTVDGSTLRKSEWPFQLFCCQWEMCYQPNIVPGPSISGFLWVVNNYQRLSWPLNV